MAASDSDSGADSASETVLVGLDWGTSSLRAYRIGAAGEVLQARIVSAGIMKLPEGGFAKTLVSVIGDWLNANPGAAIMASGMVGARQGWVEAPYADAPAALADLADACVPVELGQERVLHIVPGIRVGAGTRSVDVMRGEETQAIGALPDSGNAHMLLPGTHSKWLSASERCITAFSTYMTGELYELLSKHSILAASMQDDEDDGTAFDSGVKDGFEHGRALMRRLFAVRAMVLNDVLAAGASRAYLSGLLVGAEIADGVTTLSAEADVQDGLTVVGEARLSEIYLRALGLLGVSAHAGPSEAAPLGLFRIGKARGLL